MGGPLRRQRPPAVLICTLDRPELGSTWAKLYSLTGDLEFARTALAAIHRSIRQLDNIPPIEAGPPLSFYCGHLGVAYARAGSACSPIEQRLSRRRSLSSTG